MTQLRQWCNALLATVDAKDSHRFAEYLTPEALFRFGNGPPVSGTRKIVETLDDFFMGIASLSHQISDVWELHTHRICRGEVSYAHHDGSIVRAPFCNVLTMDHGKVARYEIYLDPTGLFPPR